MKNQMDFVRGFQPKKQSRLGNIHGGGRGGQPDDDDYKLVVEYPGSRVLRVFSRSLLLALAIYSFPWIGSLILDSSSNAYYSVVVVSEPIDNALLPILIKDLSNVGILNTGDKALFFSNGEEITDDDDDDVEASSSFKENLRFLNDNEMNVISEYDFERQSSVPDNTFDFILVSGFGAVKFIDRTLKTGGIVVVQLSDNNPSSSSSSSMNTFQKPINYKIEYLRRFKSTIVGLRKTSPSFKTTTTTTRHPRRLFGFDSKAKKEEALKGLEDVLLEPPPRASSYKHLTNYLPDLMDDSLEGYPRRVYVDVGSSSSIEWFKKNYPTRKTEFEMYKIEIERFETEEEFSSKGEKKKQVIGMSDWLKKNVKEEEFVVMKAEVEVVEEMMKNKVISLVDELFLECRHQLWQGENKMKKNDNMSKRAYWECLALYGRLRDEGVAVHQWWSS